MRKPYSPQRIAEVVAMAVIVGAEEAARQTGIDPRTIRKWSLQAGKAPADAISSTDWRSLGDLARSQVAAKLAAGKVTPVQAATIAGIAERNAREIPPPEREASPEEAAWSSALEAALAAKYGIDLADERADEILDDCIRDLARWQHSEGRPELWDDPAALVAALPEDWDAWHADRRAKQAAIDAEMEARRSRSRPGWESYYRDEITEAQRDAWIRDGTNPYAEADAALIAAAEAFLRENA